MSMNPLVFGSANFEGLNPNFNPQRVEEYISPLLSAGAGTVRTVNHGLSKTPTDVQLFLQCITTEGNYSPGDIISVDWINRSTTTANQDDGASVFVSDTQLAIMTDTGTFKGNNKTTGLTFSATAANWKMFVVARVFTQGGIPDITKVPDVVLAEGTIFNQPTLELALDIAHYNSFTLKLPYAVPATDGVSLYSRTSSDGGATFDSAAGSYGYNGVRQSVGVAPASIGNNSVTQILVNGTLIGSAAAENGQFELNISNPSDANFTQVFVSGSYEDSGGRASTIFGGGRRLEAAQVNAVQILFSSGNIEVMSYELTGHRGMNQ